MKKLKSKIISKFPTLIRVKELEKKLEEEKVIKMRLDEIGNISYKGEKYITLYLSESNARRARERGEEVGKKVIERKEKEIEALQKSNWANCETITNIDKANTNLHDNIKELNNKLSETQKALEESLQREGDLRKDLIEVMKLNNQLNSRTIETKTIASEPIEIKPVKKSKKKANPNNK